MPPFGTASSLRRCGRRRRRRWAVRGAVGERSSEGWGLWQGELLRGLCCACFLTLSASPILLTCACLLSSHHTSDPAAPLTLRFTPRPAVRSPPPPFPSLPLPPVSPSARATRGRTAAMLSTTTTTTRTTETTRKVRLQAPAGASTPAAGGSARREGGRGRTTPLPCQLSRGRTRE